MGSNIIAYSSGNKILRILPVLHEGVNEDWINDRTRFNYDGFFIQRLTKGYYRKGDGFEKIDWESLFIKFLIENSLILSENNLFVVGQGLSSKGALALKDFCSRYNDTILDEIGLGGLIPDFRSSFCFNTGYTGLAKTDLCVLAGINLQAEMPLLLMRLRKEQRTRNLNVICFGQQKLDGVVTYNVGNSFSEIVKFAEGKHPICSLHHSSEKPMLIIGNGFLSLPFTSTILSKLFRLFQKGIWNGFNVLLSGSSSYHMYEFGLTKFFKKVNTSFNKISFLNTDGVNLKKKSDAYSFWSSHGSRSSSNFNLILPLLSNYEKDGLFLNNEGRAQFSKFVIKGPEFARTDESVLKSLESLSFKNSKATSIDQRSLSHLIVNVGKYQTFSCTEQVSKIKTLNLILSSEKHSVLADDHISKSSRLLAEANKTMEANRNLHFK
jgi:NADH dehydrogenase/NADH:ubiquinone oxidoreductase subunit G